MSITSNSGKLFHRERLLKGSSGDLLAKLARLHPLRLTLLPPNQRDIPTGKIKVQEVVGEIDVVLVD